MGAAERPDPQGCGRDHPGGDPESVHRSAEAGSAAPTTAALASPAQADDTTPAAAAHGDPHTDACARARCADGHRHAVTATSPGCSPCVARTFSAACTTRSGTTRSGTGPASTTHRAVAFE